MHDTAHPLAGKKVKIKFVEPGHFQLEGLEHEYTIEDWWDKITGGSWMWAEGNPAAIIYGMRAGLAFGKIPTDDEVVYGKINGLGHLVHVSEILEEVKIDG